MTIYFFDENAFFDRFCETFSLVQKSNSTFGFL